MGFFILSLWQALETNCRWQQCKVTPESQEKSQMQQTNRLASFNQRVLFPYLSYSNSLLPNQKLCPLSWYQDLLVTFNWVRSILRLRVWSSLSMVRPKSSDAPSKSTEKDAIKTKIDSGKNRMKVERSAFLVLLSFWLF